MNSFEKRQWQIQEFSFYPERMPHIETIFTIGNGLIGTRGTFEEGYPDDNSATVVAGIFDHHEDELVPDLASIPNWLDLTIAINGEVFRLDEGKILGYERFLDMKTATLHRGVLWLSPNRTIVRLAFERFASLDNPHVLAIRMLLQVLSEGQHTIEVTSLLDGTVLNPQNIDHWKEIKTRADSERLVYEAKTQQSEYLLAMSSVLLIDDKEATWSSSNDERAPSHQATFTVEENEKVFITKLTSIHTTRDTQAPNLRALQTLQDALETGYVELHLAHQAAWKSYWHDMDIVIEGDEVAQQAVRFCLYHILIATPTHEDRVSIGAKTLSGFGYRGHVFWDTELFIVPPLTLMQPSLARNLLMYRYHNLAGARKKAKAEGYNGAMFPWESTDTGEETTPKWTNPDSATGEIIRIWTGDNEQHISTDIAYAVYQYWQWTGDDDWFTEYGAEIILDTARFWESRVEWKEDSNRYELSMQIGPDEYHENIDNSIFTNRMVVWHLYKAKQVWHWLQTNSPENLLRLAQTLTLNDENAQNWEDIADQMWLPLNDENDSVFEQFDGFFERLSPINLVDYIPRTTNMDWILGHEKTQRTRVIKQADVVMLMALLFDDLGDKEFLHRNWEVYSAIVDHGSSLSPSIHAWVATRLGLIDRAYDDFIYSATMDIQDTKGNVGDGIHAASCGGVVQAVLFGFCGLQIIDHQPKLNPALPSHWRKVKFTVNYRGKPYTFTIEHRT